MNSKKRSAVFDPYRPIDKSIKSGDVMNRWVLSRPRQRIVQLLKGLRVLDVCCGTGNLTEMLAAAGCQAVGVDSSPTMLSHARRKSIAAEFKQIDAAELPFQDEFDAAVISIALHEMPPQIREKVWESMKRAVHPTGRLVVLDFAVPQRNNLFARIASRLIERDERSFLNIHPEHYTNFQELMHSGGLLAWVEKHGQPVEAVYRFFGETVAVVVINNQ